MPLHTLPPPAFPECQQDRNCYVGDIVKSAATIEHGETRQRGQTRLKRYKTINATSAPGTFLKVSARNGLGLLFLKKTDWRAEKILDCECFGVSGIKCHKNVSHNALYLPFSHRDG